MSAPSYSIALVVGEHSGDRLGASLMQGLKEHHPGKISFCGLGGPLMAKEGLAGAFAIDEVSIVGFLDILLSVPKLLRRIRQTADAIIAAHPDILVVIDSPDFTHRVARRVRRALPALPVVNYAPPQVWAWRPGRAARMNEYIDRVITILPFEAAEFAALDGPEAHYAGHPLTQVKPQTEAGKKLRRRYSLSPDANLVLLAPGSRKRELMRLTPLFAASARQISAAHPALKFLWLAAPGQEQRLQALLQMHHCVDLAPITGDKPSALAAANLALAASGTINLELALAGVPFICAYKVSRFEEKIVRSFVRVDDLCLVNLIIGRRAVPEHVFQETALPKQISAALTELLAPVRQAEMKRDFAELRRRMEAGLQSPPGGRRCLCLKCFSRARQAAHNRA